MYRYRLEEILLFKRKKSFDFGLYNGIQIFETRLIEASTISHAHDNTCLAEMHYNFRPCRIADEKLSVVAQNT